MGKQFECIPSVNFRRKTILPSVQGTEKPQSDRWVKISFLNFLMPKIIFSCPNALFLECIETYLPLTPPGLFSTYSSVSYYFCCL